MDIEESKTLCMEHILPILGESMGFEPKIKLAIAPKEMFDFFFSQIHPELNPDLSDGFMINKETVCVKEDPRYIAYGFIHELLHIYYPRKKGESYLRYEMRVRFLSFSVFYGIMIYVLGRKKAQELFALISFRLDVPDYLKKNFP